MGEAARTFAYLGARECAPLREIADGQDLPGDHAGDVARLQQVRRHRQCIAELIQHVRSGGRRSFELPQPLKQGRRKAWELDLGNVLRQVSPDAVVT